MAVEVLDLDRLENGNVLHALVNVPADDKFELVESIVDAMVGPDRAAASMQEKREMLEQHVGAEQLDQMLSMQVAQRAAAQVINQEKLHIMFDPALKGESIRGLFESGPVEFVVEIVLRPTYELSSYEPVHVKVPPVNVTDQMVDSSITQLMESFAAYDPADGPAVEGDYVVASMQVTADGNPAPALSGEKKTVPLTRGMMPDGFIDNVVGMQAGESKTFDFEDTHPGPQGEQTVAFHVEIEITERRRRVIPALSDQFVAQNLPDAGTTVPELRESVRKMIEEKMAQQNTQQREGRALQELTKRLKGSIPDVYLELMGGEIINRLRSSAASQGMTLEQFMQQQGMDKQNFQMMTMMQARATLRQGFALDAAYRELGLQTEDCDVEQALSEMGGQDNVETVREHMTSIGAWFVVEDLAERYRARRWLMDTTVFE